MDTKAQMFEAVVRDAAAPYDGNDVAFAEDAAFVLRALQWMDDEHETRGEVEKRVPRKIEEATQLFELICLYPGQVERDVVPPGADAGEWALAFDAAVVMDDEGMKESGDGN